jgi:hypothetical protein
VQLDLPSKTQDNHSDDGLYLDSEEENMDEAENENENWNLVDVIPAFGTRANNGYEGENIFQLGAANIMPRVTNMVESLSRRSRSEEQEQPLQPHEYFFNYLQRRKK